jgi:hypothetical protein
MSEAAVRLMIVAAIGLAVILVMSVRRLRPVRGRRIATTLEPGVYLFSSRSCLECDPARARLLEHFGWDGFVEVAWESDRQLFEEAGIDAVPTTLLVGEKGRATFVEGIPGQVLESFSP